MNDHKKKSKCEKKTKDAGNGKKAHSLLSLNVTSLTKLNGNKLNASTPDMMTKSVSETNMVRQIPTAPLSTDDETSRNISAANSVININVKSIGWSVDTNVKKIGWSVENNLNGNAFQRNGNDGGGGAGGGDDEVNDVLPTPAINNSKPDDAEEEVLIKHSLRKDVIIEEVVTDNKPLNVPDQTK